MNEGLRDVARIRLDNAMRLFDEFVTAAIKHPDAATLRGLERRFAERLQIQPSYWSQIKGGTRQIGERLARQFEILCAKPRGWMDEEHVGAVLGALPALAAPMPSEDTTLPVDDDERFIVGLVLTYYRRHPERARARLLDLLGEVLAPVPAPGVSKPPPKAPAAAPSGEELWQRARSGAAPLKRK